MPLPNDLLGNDGQTFSNDCPPPSSAFDQTPSNVFHLPTMNDSEAVSNEMLTTSAGTIGLSPTAAWLYRELSSDQSTALSLSTIDPSALQKENIFDSLWDLQGNVDLFVTANKEAENSIFPVSFPPSCIVIRYSLAIEIYTQPFQPVFGVNPARRISELWNFQSKF
jgi:hypothetical protein